MEEREEFVNNERDWSGLPADIVHLIAKKLPDLFEFVCFSAVCKSWRSSAPLSDPPQKMPWLLEFSGGTFESLQSAKTTLRFYSITSGKTVTIPRNKNDEWFRGVSCHYLPCYNEREDAIYLFNPLTKKEIVYPPIRDIPYMALSPWMVWTDTSPIHDRNILVIERNSYPNEIGRWVFYDAKNKRWTDDNGFFYAFCYCQGKLISTYNSFETEVRDISSKKLLYKIPHPDDGYHHMWSVWVRRPYLVESSGEILAVYWFQHQQHMHFGAEDSFFDIRRLDFGAEDGQPFWVRISDIGDRILFLEVRNGFSMTASPSTTGFRRGCIYFIQPFGGELYVYHVVTGSMEKVPCPFKKCTWFLPGLN